MLDPLLVAQSKRVLQQSKLLALKAGCWRQEITCNPQPNCQHRTPQTKLMIETRTEIVEGLRIHGFQDVELLNQNSQNFHHPPEPEARIRDLTPT